MRIRIDVTEEHIERARKALGNEAPRTSYCPIAIALSEAMDRSAWVGKTAWYLGTPGYGNGYRLPAKARKFVRLFDAFPALALPFHFNLTLPEGVTL